MTKNINFFIVIFTFIIGIGVSVCAYAQDDVKTDKEDSANESSECVSVCVECNKDAYKEFADVNPERYNGKDSKKYLCMEERSSYCSKKCKHDMKCAMSCLSGDEKKYCEKRCKEDGFSSLLSCLNGCGSSGLVVNWKPTEICGLICMDVKETINNVKLGNVEIKGKNDNKPGLDKQTIKKEVQNHLFELNRCYHYKLRNDNNFNEHIVVSWIIHAKGNVSKAVIKESKINNEYFEKCIVDEIQKWQFTKPKNDGMVYVEYTIDFRPKSLPSSNKPKGI